MDPNDLRALLARNVRRIADRKGISLNVLADSIGISRGTIHYVATAQTAATVDTIARIAEGLGVHPSKLLSDETPAGNHKEPSRPKR